MKALQKAKRLAIAFPLLASVSGCEIFSSRDVVINDYCTRYEEVGLEEAEAELLPYEKALKIDRNDVDYVKNCLGEDFDASSNGDHDVMPNSYVMHSLVLKG